MAARCLSRSRPPAHGLRLPHRPPRGARREPAHRDHQVRCRGDHAQLRHAERGRALARGHEQRGAAHVRHAPGGAARRRCAPARPRARVLLLGLHRVAADLRDRRRRLDLRGHPPRDEPGRDGRPARELHRARTGRGVRRDLVGLRLPRVPHAQGRARIPRGRGADQGSVDAHRLPGGQRGAHRHRDRARRDVCGTEARRSGLRRRGLDRDRRAAGHRGRVPRAREQ